MRKTIHSPEYGKLIEMLIALRQEVGMTQRQLAEKLQVHHSWVAKVELGERRLDVLEAVRLIKAVGGDLNKIIRELMNIVE